MSDVDVTRDGGATSGRDGRGNIFSRIILFIRQVIGEMRKVVYPTRDELRTYTIAVLVFLAVIMAYINGLDWVFTRAVSWVFGQG